MLRRFYTSDSRYTSDVTLRVSEISRWFNLRFDINRVSNLLMWGMISSNQLDFITELHRVIEDIHPGMGQIQFEFAPKLDVVRNTYGYHHPLLDMYGYHVFTGFKLAKIFIIIRFPEVTVTNSRGSSIPIKDLFVRIPIELNVHTPKYDIPEGLRLTVSAAEYDRGYLHSHLQSRNLSTSSSRDKFSRFCLGESDTRMTLSLLNAEPKDYDLLRLLLLNLKMYVSWESLEGTPHHYLEHVLGKVGLPDIDSSTPKIVYEKLIEELRERKEDGLDINWRFLKGRYHIIDDEQFESELRRLILRRASTHFLIRDELGKYFKISYVSITNDLVGVQQEEWIPFRGQKHYFKVEETTFRINIETKYLHPTIKKYIKNELEHKANLQNIRKIALDYASTSADT